MFRDGISDSGVNIFSSNIMQTHVPKGEPSGHPHCRGPSWLVGKELEFTVPFDRVLDLEFFHKLNRIVVCDNLFVMHAKILRQNMQQGILGFLKVNVELLLLFLVEIIKIKKGVPG
mgnify:CR=1 FL=1